MRPGEARYVVEHPELYAGRPDVVEAAHAVLEHAADVDELRDAPAGVAAAVAGLERDVAPDAGEAPTE